MLPSQNKKSSIPGRFFFFAAPLVDFFFFNLFFLLRNSSQLFVAPSRRRHHRSFDFHISRSEQLEVGRRRDRLVSPKKKSSSENRKKKRFESLGAGRGAARRTQGGRGVAIAPGELSRRTVRPRAGTSLMGTSQVDMLQSQIPSITRPASSHVLPHPLPRNQDPVEPLRQPENEPNAQTQAQPLPTQQPLNKPQSRPLVDTSAVQNNLNTLLTSSDHQNMRSRVQLSTHTNDQLFLESDDENQDPKQKGRSCNKDVDQPADTLEERVLIVPLPSGDWPVDSKIMRTIGYIIRQKSQHIVSKLD
ncbi:hypothetical protein OROMI_003833 [Orobanche minor]